MMCDLRALEITSQANREHWNVTLKPINSFPANRLNGQAVSAHKQIDCSIHHSQPMNYRRLWSRLSRPSMVLIINKMHIFMVICIVNGIYNRSMITTQRRWWLAAVLSPAAATHDKPQLTTTTDNNDCHHTTHDPRQLLQAWLSAQLTPHSSRHAA